MHIKKIPAVVLGILALLILLIAISISRLERPSKEYSQQLEKLPYTFDFGTSPHPNPSIIGFDGPFPKMPYEMMVYKVVHPNNITEAYVRELAQKHFGMPADANMTRSSGLGLYWLNSSTHRFEVDPKTGSFNIHKLEEKGTRYSKNREDYPSDEECKKIAAEFIKSRGLFEAGMYLGKRVVDNTKGSGVMSLGFGQNISGYKKWGAGGRISIHIGPGGEVVKVSKAWRELAPYKRYPIKTAKQALKDLHKRKGFLTGLKGKIIKITLRYYTSSEKQDYVQPIYFFECSGPERNFYGVVPAIKNGYIQSREEYWKELEEERRTPSE